MDKTKLFLKKYWGIILILFIGSVFRLYKINEYMTFLGDEGRDVVIVRNLLAHADPILIGPGTSIGGMYLGPLYYYLIAIPLLLANFSPVGPAIFVAILGIITIWLVYFIGKEWFGEKAGLISALLFAISPTVIVYSRSSWNPNIMPFFALLTIYSIWKFYNDLPTQAGTNYKYLVLCAVSFAFVLQSHYLGLLLAPTILLFYVLKIVNCKFTEDCKLLIDKLRKNTFLAVGIFVLLMSPLAIFDLRHDYMNSRALYKFLTVRQETVSIRPWTSLEKIPTIFTDINSSLLVAKNTALAKWITVFFVGLLIWFRKKLMANGYLLITWLSFGLIGLGLYKQHIYDHYYGFLFPVVFLLTGFLITKLNKYLTFFITLILVVINLQKNPLLFHPNKQMQRSINVANLVLEKDNDKPFNLAVLAERNYEDGYRYFLEKGGVTPMHADRWDGKTITDQLFVICEMEEKKCDPTHSPKAEVANFGMSKIDDKWIVDGVIIYKLSHAEKL